MLDSPFARKLSAFAALSDDHLTVLSDLYARRRHFPVGNDTIHEAQSNQTAFILNTGWACWYKLTPGGTRQIVDFRGPGDFLGLRSILLRTSDHTIEPITPVKASEVQTSKLLDLFARMPRPATAALWAAWRDEAMLVEHLVGLGRRNVAERTRHFLLELAARLRLAELGDKTGYACPLSQYMLADVLGSSAVYINRILRKLREAALATFQSGQVVFDDVDALVVFSKFDRAYLDHQGPLLRQGGAAAKATAQLGSTAFFGAGPFATGISCRSTCIHRPGFGGVHCG